MLTGGEGGQKSENLADIICERSLASATARRFTRRLTEHSFYKKLILYETVCCEILGEISGRNIDWERGPQRLSAVIATAEYSM